MKNISLFRLSLTVLALFFILSTPAGVISLNFLPNVSIPITYGINKLYHAQFIINVGEKSNIYKGIVDTGATYSFLPLTIAEELIESGIAEYTSNKYYSGITEQVGQMYIMKVQQVYFGKCILKDVEFGVIKKSSNLIIIGNSMLERFGIISIDYKANILTAKSCPIS